MKSSNEIKAEAHRIRNEARKHWGVKAGDKRDIRFIDCWNMAKKGQELPWENKVKASPEQIAQEMAEELGGNVWANYGKVRVYVYKNFLAITDQGIDFSGLGRNDNEEMQAAAHAAAERHNLETYEIYRGRKIAA